MFAPSMLSVSSFMVCCVLPNFVVVHSASSGSRRFESRWQPSIGDAMADAASEAITMPSSCKFAVVGAGWGGAYAAWRLAIDDATLLTPSDVCIFEATNRVGGRIFSVRNLPGLGDMAIDAGGYRFKETDLLPGQLVWDALKLPTACYDYNCSGGCEGGNCFIIKDAYGNNAGYAKPIETMLGQIEDEGKGQQVFFGKQLTGMYSAAASRKVQLKFADGTTTIADKVLLNLPSTAIQSLDASSIIFTNSSSRVKKGLQESWHFPASKVYAFYEDAWWSSKLGFMEGYLTRNRSTKSPIPLSGRYHDGPLKCIIGRTPAGDPVYSGKKIAFGNCSGALEVYYNFGDDFFQRFMTNPLKPLAVFDASSKQGAKVIDELHDVLMDYHHAAFIKKGIHPSILPKPSLVTVSNWLVDAPVAPSCGSFWGRAQDETLLRRPAPAFDVYVADVDYGSGGCWAVGSLTASEKVLHAEFKLNKPQWLDEKWYQDNILSMPHLVV